MIDTLAEFKELKNIDKDTMISVLEDSFRNVIAKMFGTDENYDVIINPEKGDFEIWRNRTVVADDELEDENLQLTLTSNDTIERGIKKAAGDANSVNYVQNTYEGYGPNGIAIIVETLTDNKNRTAANVRSAFSKGRGNIGTSGCVSFMFQKKGQIIVSKEEYETDPDEFMMVALDAGAEDFVEEDDSYEITTDPDVFGEVREALEKEGVPMASAEVTMIPDNYVTLTDPEDIKNLNRTLDLLDEDDDVQAVYHNWEEE